MGRREGSGSGDQVKLFWRGCVYSGTLCRPLHPPPPPPPPSLSHSHCIFPHQTPASTDDALKESLRGLHSK